MMISPARSSIARSIARVTFSPTTEPIEPPMNEYSMAEMTTGMPPIVPRVFRTASLWPVRSRDSAIRSRYGFVSRKLSGSTETRFPSNSSHFPPS